MSSSLTAAVEEIASPVAPARGTRGVDPLDVSFDEIIRALAGLRFGEVRIVVQDSVVVQVDRTEKRRLR